MIHSLRHFGLVVRDVDKSLDFYCRVLGLHVVRQMEESGDFIDAILARQQARVTTVKLRAENGPTLLELLHFRSPAAQDAGQPSLFCTGATHFAMTVENLRELYESLQRQGEIFLSAPQSSPDSGALVCFGRDPEGNLIEFVEELTSRDGRCRPSVSPVRYSAFS